MGDFLMIRFATVLVESVLSVAYLVMWVAGIVLAHGFWSTTFAIFTGGLWSLYLVVEKALTLAGLL
jgi:hypothetical protein